MKKLFTLSIAFIPVMAIAQNCKYDKDTFDKFQKVRKIEKEVKVVKKFNRGDGFLNINLCNYGGQTFFRLYTAQLNSIVVGKHDAVVFLLDNDAVINAYPDQIYNSESNGPREWFEGTYEFESDSAINELKAHKVKSMRLYYNSVYKDYDLKGNGSDKLFDAIKCF
jgi:hypothetical protein